MGQEHQHQERGIEQSLPFMIAGLVVVVLVEVSVVTVVIDNERIAERVVQRV